MRNWRLGASPDEMREVDRRAETEFGLTPVMLMESAGLAVARVARDMLGGSVAGRAVSILAGPGNNGGDGLVAARRLAGWGARARIITTFPQDAARGLAALQLDICVRAGVPAEAWSGETPGGDLVIDALLGFGAGGAPRGVVADVIAGLDNASPMLAVDIPSGLDALSGIPEEPCVRAARTVTLALAKTGLLYPSAREFVGALWLADIGIPPALWARAGVDVEGLFAAGDIERLW